MTKIDVLLLFCVSMLLIVMMCIVWNGNSSKGMGSELDDIFTGGKGIEWEGVLWLLYEVKIEGGEQAVGEWKVWHFYAALTMLEFIKHCFSMKR